MGCNFEQEPHSFQNITGAGVGNIADGKKSVSFMNIGNTDALVDGVVLPAGVSIDFTASQGNGLAAFTYDAQLSNLLITTVG